MRTGLPEDLFSYSESVFREDLFLYNFLQVYFQYVVRDCKRRREAEKLKTQ